MDQKAVKGFIKSLSQIYYITFLENLVKTLGGDWGVCSISIFDSFDAFNPLT